MLGEPNFSHGTIKQIDASGVGLLEDDETFRKYPFTFDCIKGYYGQPIRKTGIVPGAHVKFYTFNDIVKFVERG